MGLSNQERVMLVFDVIHELTRMYERTGVSPDNPVALLVKQLYATALSQKSDGTYWVFGGSTTELSQRCNPESPLGEALVESLEKMLPKPEHAAPLPTPGTDYWRLEQNGGPLSMQNLLQALEHLYEQPHLLYRTYALSERFFYAANRYDDKLSESLQPLRELMSRIAMTVTQFLRESPDFGRAWTFHQFARYLVEPYRVYSDDDRVSDPILRMMLDQQLHFDISSPPPERMAELGELIVELDKYKPFEVPLRLRLEVFIQLLDYRRLTMAGDNLQDYILRFMKQHQRGKKYERIPAKWIQQQLEDQVKRSAAWAKQPYEPLPYGVCWFRRTMI